MTRLVLAEPHDTIDDAIRREKQLKAWRRAWKIALIEKANPDWRDLWEHINGQGTFAAPSCLDLPRRL